MKTEDRNALEWRCRKCGTLLGILSGKSVHLKHKRGQLVVRGHVVTVCLRCAELNEFDTPLSRIETRFETRIKPSASVDGSFKDPGWNPTQFLVASIVASALSSSMLRIIRPRGAYMTGAALIGAGMLVCEIVPSIPGIFAGRIMQAIGGGLMVAVTHSFFDSLKTKRCRREPVGRSRAGRAPRPSLARCREVGSAGPANGGLPPG